MSVTQQRGMLWGTLGTYRRVVGAGKIIRTRARTREGSKSAISSGFCPSCFQTIH